MQLLGRARVWWNAPKQLAAAEKLVTAQREALEAAVQSLQLVKYDRDELAWNTDPRNRRDLEERNHLNDEVEAWMLAGAGPRMDRPTKESLPAAVPVQIKERLWELELALEDRGWQRQLALAQTEFSRYGLQQIILISRLMFIKNPLIRRWVLISGYYTFGRGVEISCDDEDANEVIQDFLTANVSEFGQIGLIEKDNSLHTDGQVFFVFFADKGKGGLKVRTIPATEITDIITNPDDTSEARYFQRRWVQRVTDPATGVTQNEMMEKFYPALAYEDAVDSIGGVEVLRDQPVYHMKVGGLKEWLFGLPEVYCGIDWARAYKSFLEDWASLNRALARFAWNLETKGGVAAIQNFQKVLSTTLGQGGTQIESNPPPTTGSAFVTGPGNKLEPIKTAGSTNNPEQGRRVLLMLCAGAGLPETFFGDASTGSLATAVSLDRPTELKFLERQERWRAVLQVIVTYALQQSNKAPKGKLREARQKANLNGDLSDLTVNVKFPAVLEHDIAIMVSAIVQAATLGGFQLGGTMDMRTTAQLLMAELGVEDPKAVVDAMYPPEETGDTKYDPKNYADNGKADAIEDAPALPPQPGAHLVTPSFGKESARLQFIVDRLLQVSRKLQESR
jgi:hypothetical protein